MIESEIIKEPIDTSDNFKNGQLIKASVNKYPFIKHYGLIYLTNEISKVYVMHNTPNRGPVIDTLNDFKRNRTIISRTDTVLTDKVSSDFILNKFSKVEQKKFNLLTFNCEHFIDYMLDNKMRSEQLTSWFFLITILGIITYLIVKKRF